MSTFKFHKGNHFSPTVRVNDENKLLVQNSSHGKLSSLNKIPEVPLRPQNYVFTKEDGKSSKIKFSSKYYLS